MATFRARIACTNGYKPHEVEVSGVVTQAAARRMIEAQNPGASVRHVRLVSNKD